jgi:hypothetical protein
MSIIGRQPAKGSTGRPPSKAQAPNATMAPTWAVANRL